MSAIDESGHDQVAESTDGGSIGMVDGKHYTEHVEAIKALKRNGLHADTLTLCLRLIEAVEAEHAYNGLSAAPWYYDQAALAARRTGKPEIERSVMERYLAMPDSNPEYDSKFLRALAKLEK